MASLSYPLSDIYLSGNLPDIGIQSLAGEATVVLKMNGNEVNREVYNPVAGGFVIKLKSLIDSLLYSLVPDADLDLIIQPGSMATFELLVTDGSAAVDSSFKVLKGGIDKDVDTSVFLSTNFLTWQPQSKKVQYSDPQFLSYCSLVACKVKVKAYYADSTTQTIEFASLAANHVYSLNLSYARMVGKLSAQPVYFDVWIEDVAAARLSYIQRYIYVSPSVQFNDIFVFENTLGGIDTVHFLGELKETNEIEYATALFGEEDVDYDIDFSRLFVKQTGYVEKESDRYWWLEFFKSLQRYHITSDGALRKIVVSKPKLDSVAGVVNSYEFTFAYALQTKYISLPRLDALPSVVNLTDPAGDLFFLAPRLAQFLWIQASDNPLIPVQLAYSDTWGVISVHKLLEDVEIQASSLGSNLNAIGYRVGVAESTLSIQAGQIALKASQVDVNSLGSRMSAAESSLTIQSGQITLKVDQTIYNQDLVNTKASAGDILTSLADIANDGKLTPVERQTVKKDWSVIKGEQPDLLAQAALYAVSSTSLTDAFNALSIYITPIVTDPLLTFDSTSVIFDQVTLVNMVVVTPIDKTVFNQKFTDYYNAKIALIKALTDAGKTYVNSVKTILETSITQTQESITLKASQTDLTALGTRVGSAESSIVVNATAIALKASKDSVDTLTGRVTTAEASITTQAGQIALKATQTDLTAIGTRVTTAESSIVVNAEAIALKASKDSVDTLTGRVTTAEASITTQAGQIALKATQTDLTAIGTRVTTAESSIVVNAEAIALKASKDSVDALTGRVTTAESSITTQAGQIALKATQTDLTAIGTRVTTAESSIVVNAEAIALKASKDSVDALTGRVTTAESSITTQAGQIALKASQVDVNSLGSRMSAAESSLTIQSGQITLKVDQTIYNQDLVNTKASAGDILASLADIANDGKLTPVERQTVKKDWSVIKGEQPDLLAQAVLYNVSSTALTDAFNALSTYITPIVTDPLLTFDSTSVIFDQVTLVNMVVVTPIDKTVFNQKFTDYYNAKIALIKALTDAGKTYVNSVKTILETSITQTQTSITLKASQTDLTALGTRVTTAESAITVNANAIDLKVAKSGVIAAINISPEEINISASKINITGDLNLAGIFNGTLIKASAIDVDNLTAKKLAATTGTISGFLIMGDELRNIPGKYASINLYDDIDHPTTIFKMRNATETVTNMALIFNGFQRSTGQNVALELSAVNAPENIALRVIDGDIQLHLKYWGDVAHDGSQYTLYWDNLSGKIYYG